MMSNRAAKKFYDSGSFLDIMHKHDRRMDTAAQQRPRLHIVSCGKRDTFFSDNYLSAYTCIMTDVVFTSIVL